MAGNLVIDNINGVDIASSPVLNDTQLRSALNASGEAPIYACRAWVNFNGTGTVAIRASGNVSSITDNGTGDYTVNFTTEMPTDKYVVSGFVRDTNNNYPYVSGSIAAAPTSASCRIRAGNGANAAVDATDIAVSFIC